MLIVKTILLLILLLSHACADPLSETVACVREAISHYEGRLRPELYRIFSKAFPNTLTTTIQHYDLTPGNESLYIITGDIEAMWLRDSTNQFLPYLQLGRACPSIQALASGLLNTQAEFIMVDPYTNAFKLYERRKADRPSYLNDRTTKLVMGMPVDLCRGREYATQKVWERKFEVDSLAAFLRLAHEHYAQFQAIAIVNMRFLRALGRILEVLQEQVTGTEEELRLGRRHYTFARYQNDDELPGGNIKPARRTGMIKSGFRPSDSPNELPYNIPGNAMLARYLQLVADGVLANVPADSVFAGSAAALRSRMAEWAESIGGAVVEHGMVQQEGRTVLAYEVDGMGGFRLYDDANLPSLLSLPYFGVTYGEVTANTRDYVLSEQNKYFYAKGDIRGVGSSHTEPRYIWPLALTAQILTSDSPGEIEQCLASLVVSAAGDDLMHESFSVDRPDKRTREWFAWANSFFGEMILTTYEAHPACFSGRGDGGLMEQEW